MKKLWLFVTALFISGCNSSIEKPVQVAIPTPRPKLVVVVPTPRPTPRPTMTPRERRAERRAQGKKKRDEAKRIAKEKAAERRRIAIEEQEEEDERLSAQQRAKDIEEQSPSNPDSVLAQLDLKYKETLPVIIKMSEKGSEILAAEGINQSPSYIMYQMNMVVDDKILNAVGSNNLEYSDYLANYLAITVNEKKSEN